ncbi:uncharacterized protein LOC131072797 [Cryptomeria japonica]|uniref:uncharacterized protein LOC131072797 n=1 Tax=Cryptomeria japonica TaxID=3369 RepID=UPI0027DA8183|nr:uncharacterized protein LOC131072797 [Cryptomeria japonica]
METLLQNSNKNCESEIFSNECCMCGDVGIEKQLFKCTSCSFRYQHKYCSSLYPNVDLDCFSCEWCRFAEMAEREAGNTNFNNDGFNRLHSISVSNQANGLKTMQRREEGEKNSGNGGQRSQQKEKPKLIIHAGRRYKRLADF